MPRYSISNVPTEVVKYSPDPANFGRDWGIYPLPLPSKNNIVILGLFCPHLR